jgi:hypothetical protein
MARAMRSLAVLMIVTGVMIVPVSTSAAPRPAASCENVAGTFEGFALPVIVGGELVGFDIQITDGTGSLAGLIVGTVVVEKISADGTIHYSAAHTFTDNALGEFTTTDKGTVTSTGRIHNALTITSGGSGTFHVHGVVDFATGAEQLRYHGRVCI